MLNLLKNKKAQNTAEYAILIGVVVAVAIAMQVYVKRSLQGGMKYAVDKAGTGTTAQYEPYYLESSYEATVGTYKDTEETEAGGKVTRQLGEKDKGKTTTRAGYQRTRGVGEAD